MWETLGRRSLHKISQKVSFKNLKIRFINGDTDPQTSELKQKFFIQFHSIDHYFLETLRVSYYWVSAKTLLLNSIILEVSIYNTTV